MAGWGGIGGSRILSQALWPGPCRKDHQTDPILVAFSRPFGLTVLGRGVWMSKCIPAANKRAEQPRGRWISFVVWHSMPYSNPITSAVCNPSRRHAKHWSLSELRLGTWTKVWWISYLENVPPPLLWPILLFLFTKCSPYSFFNQNFIRAAWCHS